MSKQKTATIKYPDPTSKRSIRRANRGFKSLETSCRKHRRAAHRSAWTRNISGVVHPAGTRTEFNPRPGNKLSSWLHNAGGSMKFWKC